MEDDDEDEEGGGGRKRGRKALRSRYVELAAEEGESEDEDAAAERVSKRTRREEAAAFDAAYSRLRGEDAARRAREARAKTAEELAAEFERKERETGYAERDDAEAEGLLGAAGGGAMQRQAALPELRDPRLWMLKCKEGAEAEILIALLNKFVARAEAGERLGIMSAVCAAKGTIFVEAYREAQVKAAVSGISDLYSFREGAITLVPIAQMTSALRCVGAQKACALSACTCHPPASILLSTPARFRLRLHPTNLSSHSNLRAQRHGGASYLPA